MPKWNKKRILVLIILFLLIPGFLYALPVAVRMGAEEALERQGLQTRIDDVDLNLFTGRLAVTGAKGQRESGEGFQVDRLLIELLYTPFFDKRIHFKQLEIEGTRLDITRSADNRISVAGIDIPAVGGDDGDDSESTWGYGLDQAGVRDTQIRYRDELLNETLVIEATSVRDVASWAAGQAINVSAEGALQGSPLKLEGSVQPFGETIRMDMQVNTQALPLAVLSPYLQMDLQGSINSGLTINLLYSANDGVKVKTEGVAAASDLYLQVPEQAVEAGVSSATWQGYVSVAVAPESDEAPQIESKGSLKLAGLNLNQNGQGLLRAEQLSAGEIDVTSLDNIALNKVSASGVEGLIKDDASSLLKIASVDVQPLAVQNMQQLKIGQIKIAGLDGSVSRDEQQQWNFRAWLPESGQQDSGDAGQPGQGEPADDGGDSADSFTFAIDNIEVAGESRLAVADASVEPDFSTELQAIQLNVKGLDSSTPDQPSPLNLSAKVGRYGRLELNGSVKPFASNPAVDLKGRVENVNLVPLSGYSGQVVGHRIKQGTASSDIDIQMADGKIDAVFDLVLNKLKVAEARQSGEFEQQTGMPLSTALGLMRERDDNIRLQLPVTGDVDNPDVNINSIIQKAVFKAVQTALLHFYSPLGVVMAADKLVQFATALRFKPVEFEPGSVLLTKSAADYIDQIAELLSSRPQVQMSVCGYAVASDRTVVAKRVAEQGTTFFGLFKPDVEEDEVPEDALREIAAKRANIVSDYLLGRGVSEDQLIACEPAIDLQGEALPRVEVSM